MRNQSTEMLTAVSNIIFLLFYTNDLHEALLKKQGIIFWKCWNREM